MTPIEVVNRYFKAMQAGPSDAEALFALFAEDAVYVEPFSAVERRVSMTHTGLSAIKACLRSGWTRTPPDLRLEVNRVDVDGEVVKSEWTCTSPVFPAPVRGVDVCTVRGGRIIRLEVQLS